MNQFTIVRLVSSFFQKKEFTKIIRFCCKRTPLYIKLIFPIYSSHYLILLFFLKISFESFVLNNFLIFYSRIYMTQDTQNLLLLFTMVLVLIFFFSRRFLTWFLGIDEILVLLLELLCKMDVEKIKHKKSESKDVMELRRLWRIQNPHVCES